MSSIVVILAILLNPLPEWQLLTSVEGGFQIYAPGAMEHTIQPIETDLGSVDYHSYYLEMKDDSMGNFIFVASFYKLSEPIFPRDSVAAIDDFFAATIAQSAHSVAGDVIFKDDIRYRQEYPGRLWRIHFNDDQTVMKSKAYLVDNAFYSLQVAVDSDHALSDLIDYYFDSFKLLD